MAGGFAHQELANDIAALFKEGHLSNPGMGVREISGRFYLQFLASEAGERRLNETLGSHRDIAGRLELLHEPSPVAERPGWKLIALAATGGTKGRDLLSKAEGALRQMGLAVTYKRLPPAASEGAAPRRG
jgi:hypothetical protein